MKINWNAFMDSLPIMGMGMAGIFIVTGVIVLAIVLLNAATSLKNKK